MKKLNTYIVEAWSGVKKHTIHQPIIDWCEEMGIENYTINSKGEIDVDGNVHLEYSEFKELPYKFGRVNGFFYLEGCENLTSLKNCPNYVNASFDIDGCSQLASLKGCPKEVKENFWCGDCKRRFTEKEVKQLCKVKRKIYI